jgi:hypothetical protein
MKQCKTCNKVLDESCFNKMSSGKPRPHCSKCVYEKKKASFTSEEKQIQSKYRAAWRKGIKEKLVAYFGGVCTKCGETFPACVFEFHHTDPDTKEGQVAHKGSFSNCLEEAKKCVLVCSNCHRLIHYS